MSALYTILDATVQFLIPFLLMSTNRTTWTFEYKKLTCRRSAGSSLVDASNFLMDAKRSLPAPYCCCFMRNPASKGVELAGGGVVIVSLPVDVEPAPYPRTIA